MINNKFDPIINLMVESKSDKLSLFNKNSINNAKLKIKNNNKTLKKTSGLQVYTIKFKEQPLETLNIGNDGFYCTVCRDTHSEIINLQTPKTEKKQINPKYIKVCPKCKANYNTFVPSYYQEFISSLNADFIVNTTAPATGKTTGNSYSNINICLVFPGTEVGVLAPKAKPLQEAYKEYMAHVPPQQIKKHVSNTIITLKNGSSISFHSVESKSDVNFIKSANWNIVHIVEGGADKFVIPLDDGITIVDECVNRIRKLGERVILKDNEGKQIKNLDNQLLTEYNMNKLIIESNPTSGIAFQKYLEKYITEVYIEENVWKEGSSTIDLIERYYKPKQGMRGVLIQATPLVNPILRNDASYLARQKQTKSPIELQRDIYADLSISENSAFPNYQKAIWELHSPQVFSLLHNSKFHTIKIPFGLDDGRKDPIGTALLVIVGAPFYKIILWVSNQSNKEESGSFTYIYNTINRYKDIIRKYFKSHTLLPRDFDYLSDSKFNEVQFKLASEKEAPTWLKLFKEEYDIEFKTVSKGIGSIAEDVNFINTLIDLDIFKVIKENNKEFISVLSKTIKRSATDKHANKDGGFNWFGKKHISDSVRYAIQSESVKQVYEEKMKSINKQDNIKTLTKEQQEQIYIDKILEKMK